MRESQRLVYDRLIIIVRSNFRMIAGMDSPQHI